MKYMYSTKEPLFKQARSCCENLNKGNYLPKTTSRIFRTLAEEQYFHYEKHTAVETESPK